MPNHTTEQMEHLRFDHANVGYVLDGIEDATVRFGLERDFAVGQTVQLLTPSGNVFALANIEDVWTAPLRLAYHDMVTVDGRNHPSESASGLHSRMQHHYDTTINYDDDVTVLYFTLREDNAG